MKQLVVILSLILVGCSATKAPVVRISQMYIDSQMANYDLAMHIKAYMYGSLAITGPARDYINGLGTQSVEAQQGAINQLFNYRAGAADLHTLEFQIQDLNKEQLELLSTIKAFMLAVEFSK